jgi:hypothetical protein
MFRISVETSIQGEYYGKDSIVSNYSQINSYRQPGSLTDSFLSVSRRAAIEVMTGVNHNYSAESEFNNDPKG